jgi:hypothetical protein
MLKRGVTCLLVCILFCGVACCTLPAEDAPMAYSCIRIVREEPGTPGKPKITLPPGYALETGGNYEVASPGEYYVFLKGPKGAAKGVAIEWPGVKVRAVIHERAALALRAEGGKVLCDVPVSAASLRAAWGTLAVWSDLNEKDLPIRVEHNSPDRRAGKYAEGLWVDGQVRACVNFLMAARQIMRDWGLHLRIAAEKKGGISLMGSETNNPLHGDWPSHWHLIYYWPGPTGRPNVEAAGSCVPHFYMDDKGRVTSNNYGVFGRPESARKAGPRDPVVYKDPEGRPVMAIDIRPDGGVDIGPDAGQWTYSIVPGGDDGSFVDSVRVLRKGEPWIRVAARDDTAKGVLSIRIEPLDGKGQAQAETYRYDPLTGRILERK